LLRRSVERLLDYEARQLDAAGEIKDRFAALDTHELQQQTEQVAPRDACVPCPDSSPITRPRLGPKAKIPNHEGTRLRFALDSPLEGSGFELSVPRQMGNGFEALSETGPIGYRRRGLIRAVAGFAEYPD
jgi:hypothetical protein